MDSSSRGPNEGLEAYRKRMLNKYPAAYIQSLERRVDRLEAVVLALCEQDGEVTYDPKDNT